MGESKQTLKSKEFQADYKKFAKQFDDLSECHFNGDKLDKISQDFFDKYDIDNLREGIQFTVEGCKFPNCSNTDALNEDLKIVSKEAQVAKEVSESARILSDLYRRRCQGYYLNMTLQKSRHDEELDRGQAVEIGRFAIRYDPFNFDACYWIMIAFGWHLNIITSPREKTLVGRTFHRTILYCIELNPQDPLSPHLLGRYLYNVAGLGWLEKQVAEKLLGASVKGTYQEAEREFLKSHKLLEDWLPTGLWMARVLLAQKRPLDEIKPWIEFSLSAKCREPTSEIELRELKELKTKLKL